MKRTIFLAVLLSVSALTGAYAADNSVAGNDKQVVSSTGSDPATELPYQATRGRPAYARGEAQ